MNPNSSQKKQIIVVSALVILLSAASFLLFYYGRQHRVILDNRSVELADGQNYRALAGILVAVDHPTLDREAVLSVGVPPAKRPILSFKFWPGPDYSVAKAVEMMPRERIMIKVVGPKFNLKAEAFDRQGDSLGTIDTDIHLGARRNAMIRLVKLFNDLPDMMEEYPAQASPPPADDEQVPTGGIEGLVIGDDTPALSPADIMP